MSYDGHRDDPVGFMREVLRFEPWSRQAEIAEAVRDHERVAVRAANAVGKSAVAAALVPWWLAGGPGSICVTTATTERQVKRVLWREIHRRFKASQGFFRGITLTDTEAFLAHDWFAIGLSSDETEAVQGFHGSRVLVLVDEASGVDERVFAAVDGLLAGGETRLLLMSNPLRTSGTFFDAWHRDREHWHTITVSAFDTPAFTGEPVSRSVSRKLVSKRWCERMGKRGHNSNEYRVRVLAEFPTESDDSVVALGDLERAHKQSFEPTTPVVIGCDIARFGSDHTVLAVREGNRIRVARSYQGRDLMRTSGEITALARSIREQHHVRPTLVIDDVGLGGGATDRLRELGEFEVVPFNGGRSPSVREYPNRRSQLWFEFSELLPLLDLDAADEELAADLLAPTYTLTSDAKRVVEAKVSTRKRLRRSPDRADAVMLTTFVDPPALPGRSWRGRSGSSSVPVGLLPGYREPAGLRDAFADAVATGGFAERRLRALRGAVR